MRTVAEADKVTARVEEDAFLELKIQAVVPSNTLGL
jgi:hypothetical protein